MKHLSVATSSPAWIMLTAAGNKVKKKTQAASAKPDTLKRTFDVLVFIARV